MNIIIFRKLCYLVFFLLLAGCVSIPSEAPELSAELGKRISAIEDSNITLLHRFFDQKRMEVDRFIEEEWVPEFAKTFFSKPKIKKAWETIVREDDPDQRLMFIVKTGPKLQEMINKKRVELIRPLDDLERRVEQNIREEYAQIKAMNNSITSFLLSASEVAKNRNRYLEMAGVTDSKLGSLIDKTDAAVADLLKGAEDAQGKIDSSKVFVEKLRGIRDAL